MLDSSSCTCPRSTSLPPPPATPLQQFCSSAQENWRAFYNVGRTQRRRRNQPDRKNDENGSGRCEQCRNNSQQHGIHSNAWGKLWRRRRLRANNLLRNSHFVPLARGSCGSLHSSVAHFSDGMFNTILIEFHRRFGMDLVSFDRCFVFAVAAWFRAMYGCRGRHSHGKNGGHSRKRR